MTESNIDELINSKFIEEFGRGLNEKFPDIVKVLVQNLGENGEPGKVLYMVL